MNQLLIFLMKWIVPVIFVLLGVFFVTFIHGHSFLGMVCFGIAMVFLCYRVLDVLAISHSGGARLTRMILTCLLCAGILAVAVTEFFILRASRGDPEGDFQYMVVLGAKVNGTEPSLALRDRIRAAGAYLEAHPDVIAVLSGGQGSDEGMTEAACMYRELVEMGISPDRLWLEEKSTSTWENLTFSLDIIEEKTGERPAHIGLLSSEYHLFRAGLFAGECGVTASGIPASTTWFTLRLNYFLREAAGVWHYLIMGGQYHD